MIKSWLTSNGTEIKAAASLIQSIAVAGGIGAAIYEFLLSPQVEERERTQVTMPYLNNAYSDKLNSARDAYEDAAAVIVENKIMMCGSRPGCLGSIGEQELLLREREMSSALRPLAHYYGVLAQCVESSICSARGAARGYAGQGYRLAQHIHGLNSNNRK